MTDTHSPTIAPRIIIGAETEYGIFATSGTKEPGRGDAETAARYMIEEAHGIFGEEIFQGSVEGIRTLAEHDSAEKILAELRGRRGEEGKGRTKGEHALLSDLSEKSGALLQRLGYSGTLLPNGARYYVDMGHPEYSIPETDNPFDALREQKKGDLIVAECRRRAEDALRREWKDPRFSVRVDKNNSDGHGASYAGHGNYSLSPRVFYSIVHGREHAIPVILFFVARQIITGAGKIGSESVNGTRNADIHMPRQPYQISQRADFISMVRSPHTTERLRAIINTRDHSYSSLCKRFHVIVGDSNLSQVSLYLKFGISAIFFMMLESGFLWRDGDDNFFSLPLANPVVALQGVSRDPDLRYQMVFKDKSKKTALEVMQELLARAKRFVRSSGLGSEWQRVLFLWEEALRGLSEDRDKNEVSRSLDWVAKKRLLQSVMRRKNIDFFDPLAYAVALEYHNIDEAKSLFRKLEKTGEIKVLVNEDEIKATLSAPPKTTRAWLRGEIIRRYGSEINIGRWNVLSFTRDNDARRLLLENPHAGGEEEARFLFQGDPTLDEFLKRVENASLSGVSITRRYSSAHQDGNAERDTRRVSRNDRWVFDWFLNQ